MEQLPREVITRNIARYLQPSAFNRLSIVSKNIYLTDIYKDNYLYYDILKDYWPEETYNPKSDYIYRYQQLLKFHDIHLIKDTSPDNINESLFYAKTRDEIYYLLNMGANINFVSDHAEVPLLVFNCQSNREKSDLVRSLLENNIDIQAPDMFHKTPYYSALKNDFMEIINIFAEYKYNILNDLYYYKIINPQFVNITNVNIDKLTDKLKNVNYKDNPHLVIDIVESCMEG